MDYRIHRNPAELDSTAYIEIGPGKYTGKHWQHGFVFVEADAFELAEGIVSRHFHEYDRYSTNDIPQRVGRRITTEWRDVGAVLERLDPDEVLAELHLHPSHLLERGAGPGPRTAEIAAMLRSLAHACDEFYRTEEWVCILGL